MPLLDVPLRLLHNSHANLSWLFLPGLVALAAAAWSLGLRPAEKQATLIAVVLSPIFQEDYLYLLNDVFFLAPALAGIAFLRRNRPLAAGAMLGLSLAMKQQAVLFLPLLGLYALLNLDRRSQLRMAAGFTAVLAVLVGPFLLWDPKAFVSGTAAFFYGSGVDSYPIRGIGLQGLLLRAGVIPNRWDAFPSAQIQVPLLVKLPKQVKAGASGSRPAPRLALAALLVLAGPRSPGGVRLRAGAGAQLPRPLPGLLPGRLRLSLGRRDASSCRRRRCRSAPAPRRRNKSHH